VFQVSLFTPASKTAKRVREFFPAQTKYDRTRKAYQNAVRRFAEWRDGRGIGAGRSRKDLDCLSTGPIANPSKSRR
jgi:hypothetical protein